MADLKYFAGKPSNELVAEIIGRRDKFRDHFQSTGFNSVMQKSYRYYYGRHFSSGISYLNGEIVRMGSQGELAAFAINHYRNLIRHQLALCNSQKAALDARAVNTDMKSMQQAKVGAKLVDYYLNECGLAEKYDNATEHSLVLGKGFVFKIWDAYRGNPHTANQESGDLVYEGEVDVHTPLYDEVYIDPGLRDWSKLECADVVIWVNKWTLAAANPEQAETILNFTDNEKNRKWNGSISGVSNQYDSDIIPMHVFVHKPSIALPSGREIRYLSADIVLSDTAYEYGKEINLLRVVPGEIFGTCEGYSDNFDLLGIQEAFNTLVSIAFTNQNAQGVQKIWVPGDEPISAVNLSKGLSLIRSKVKPEGLNLTQTPAEIFNFIPMLSKFMETISGVNSTSRGDPDSSLSSGVALALVQTMAVQFASNIQRARARLISDGGTLLVKILNKKAKTQRVIPLAGKYSQGEILKYTGEDLDGIDRVIFDLGNALFRTIAGRVQVADKLIEAGLVDGQQYIDVIKTGQLDAVTQAKEKRVSLVRQENEFLLESKEVRAIVGDPHLFHAQEHMALISDASLREKVQGDAQAQAIIAATLNHIKEHDELYKTQPPFYSQIAGEIPNPQPQPPVQPMQMNQAQNVGSPEEVLAPPMEAPRIPNLNENLQPQGLGAPI